MRVLIACEESQEVCKAFRALGHEAYSCDLLPCSGGHPEWHIQDDVLSHLNDGWDIMIAFPPCTYLTVTANRSFIDNPERWTQRLDAALFVKKLKDAPIEKIAIENPKGVLSTYIGKPTQIIQPYHHGHKDSKMTCLWLKGLPWLYPTEKVEPEWITSQSGKRHSITHWRNPSTGNPENARLRSKTYSGIARAMAEQWGRIEKELIPETVEINH
jgi:site-specific DNA-cytosine methylase